VVAKENTAEETVVLDVTPGAVMVNVATWLRNGLLKAFPAIEPLALDYTPPGPEGPMIRCCGPAPQAPARPTIRLSPSRCRHGRLRTTLDEWLATRSSQVNGGPPALLPPSRLRSYGGQVGATAGNLRVPLP
jgi:hypothetical protein